MKNSESFYSFRLHNKVLKKKLDFQNCTFLRISTVQQISNSIYVNSFFFSIQYRLYQIGNVYKHCQCIGRSEMIQIRSRSRSYFGKNRQELAQFLVVVNYRDSDLIWLIFLEKKKIQIRSFQILLHDKYKQNFIKKQQNFSQIWPKSC